MRIHVRPVARLRGEVTVPGDKSISHRAALFGALAAGRTEITGFLEGEDCLATLGAVRALGAEVTRKGAGHYLVDAGGPEALAEPEDVIDCGNSGTTARLLMGVLAGQPFWAVLTGDASLRRRPMDRVAAPLRQMGATVVGRQGGSRLPLAVGGARPLRALRFASPVASAQVKTALLLAGLWADGPVTVEEPAPSRDHTERMLVAFGARLSAAGGAVTLHPGGSLRGRAVAVPGDISSAAFFLVAGAVVPDAAVSVKGVGVNPTRTGLLDVLAQMGADISRRESGAGTGVATAEPAADLRVTSARLRGTSVGGTLVPRLIDEIPALAVAACLAEGITEIRDAAELRVKESDRIRAIASELARMGATITERPDGLRIHGGRPLRGAAVSSGGDHRMAMALVVAGMLAEGETVVEDTDCIATSFPGFLDAVNALADGPCAQVSA
ncbi:MAG: 3-phosphoshikimate 1-carboxyvinyltransferase [Candidatus Rokubacteria bacterium GWC2_70_16]|nr:MAG: 3-phosphoshikimate 1-carboxyvinyltransferase [Candidatus Rokubacteria bacterium GWC2_70_16]OGL20064.1 MAG: 3-phosphoshikimate 1-carboxyvinyltransferase [Candidatus Rokubacteria bacterium RIFCSPLOWO2_12_FULL_71_19]